MPRTGINPHLAPSVGAVIKRLHARYPELGMPELIAIIRAALVTPGETDPGFTRDFANVPRIDAQKAETLARERARKP